MQIHVSGCSSPPIGVRSNAMSVSVCLSASVCISVCALAYLNKKAVLSPGTTARCTALGLSLCFGYLKTFSVDFCIQCWMSSIFLLPVLLNYWTRKCVMCFARHGENFHQAWSWYHHPLSSYSVVAVDWLHDLVTLTFNLLTLVSGYT